MDVFMDLITINRSVNENDSDIPSNVIKKNRRHKNNIHESSTYCKYYFVK